MMAWLLAFVVAAGLWMLMAALLAWLIVVVGLVWWQAAGLVVVAFLALATAVGGLLRLITRQARMVEHQEWPSEAGLY